KSPIDSGPRKRAMRTASTRPMPFASSPTAISATELRTIEKATATGSRCMRASLPIFRTGKRQIVALCAYEGAKLTRAAKEVAMVFSLSEWWMRQKVGAHVRGAGVRVEHRRGGNPYPAVTIQAGAKSCAAAKEIENRRFLSSGAPMLPLKGCTQANCQCRYLH